MKNKKTTTTTTTTRVDVRKALAEGRLTPEEERVLRMLKGIGEMPGTALQMKAAPNDEARAKLAMIEKMALDHMEREPVERAKSAESSNPRKDHIIERLRRAKRSSR